MSGRSPGPTTAVRTRPLVVMSGSVLASPRTSARTMAALLPTERGVLLTITGTCSSLGPRTSGTAGEVRVKWSVGLEVWRRDVSESCKKAGFEE